MNSGNPAWRISDILRGCDDDDDEEEVFVEREFVKEGRDSWEDA
jgi:hypothetical protein